MQFRVRYLVTLAACAAVLSACGDKEADKKTGAAAAADSTADSGLAGDAGAVPDTSTADAAPDATNKCGAMPACLDDHGKESLGLCPAPQSEFSCTAGCCVKKQICKSDTDCMAMLGTAVCPDSNFTCGCDVDSGACMPSMCHVDAECGAGKQCHQGGCLAPLADADLATRLLRPWWHTAAGSQVSAATELAAQAVDVKGNVKPDAVFEFTLAATESFTLDAATGTLKATDKAGKATVTAKVKGSSKISNAATLWNLGALAAGKNLRVTAVDDVTAAPLQGKVVVVGLAEATTPVAAMTVDLDGGTASLAGVQFPCDIHVFGKDHAPVSVLRYQPTGATGEVMLPAPLYSIADLTFLEDGTLVKAESKLVNADLLGGTVTYPGDGEAGVGVTSLAFGPGLLNFNVQSILGPKVSRPFSDEAPAIVNPSKGKPQDVPGGVTFLLGKPVVTHYVLAGAPGKHTLWTLAGRVALSDVIPVVSAIVDNVQDGIDIGKVVSLLLPYFSSFRSQVVFDLPFADKLTEPMSKLDLAPTFPLGHHVEVTMVPLPAIAEKKWADLAFVIGGALMPQGEIVPLGLTAGADKGGGDNDKVADGNVDGDPTAPGAQPLQLSAAPLHSGTRVGAANHVLVTAAVVLADKAQGKREGASLQITEPGVLPKTFTPEAFLPLPAGSTYDMPTATLNVKVIEGAQFYRVTIQGPEDAQWLMVLPASMAGKPVHLPDLTALGGPTNLAAAAKRVYVAAFELRKTLPLSDLLAPGGMTDLVRRVKRTSFYDAFGQ